MKPNGSKWPKVLLKARKSSMEHNFTQCAKIHLFEEKLLCCARLVVLWCGMHGTVLCIWATSARSSVSYVVRWLILSVNDVDHLIPYSGSVLNRFFTFYSRLCGLLQMERKHLPTRLILRANAFFTECLYYAN